MYAVLYESPTPSVGLDRDTCKKYLKRAKILVTATTKDPDLSLQLQFFMDQLKTFLDGYKFKGI